MYTISQAKTDLQGMLHGTSLNKISGVYDLFTRAGRQVLLDVDPAETKRISQVVNAIYDQVYDYAGFSDLKGNKIIDIRPQTEPSYFDHFGQRYSRDFNFFKDIPSFNIRNNSGVKTIRIAADVEASEVVNSVNTITENGTWVIGGGASNIANDSVYKISGSGSVKFDVTGATTSYIENLTMAAVDLSLWVNQASLFVWVFMPNASQVTSVNLRWGSSNTTYYDRSVTSAHPGNAFTNGWNLLRFDWNGATVTGVPVPSGIDYLRVSITHTATNTNYRVDNIVAALPTIFEIEYYSKFMFHSAAGTWKETVTADDDEVNLDTDSYNLFLYQAALLAFQQMQDQGETVDIKFASSMYSNCLKAYRDNYKSEVLPPVSNYYRTGRKYSRFIFIS